MDEAFSVGRAGRTRVSPGLARELARVVGADGVEARSGLLATYECDAYTLERSSPDLVVLPRTPDEVGRTVGLLTRAGWAVVPRGAGTGLAGGTLAAAGAAVVATTRLRAVENLDIENRQALVQAGVVNLALTRAARPHGLEFAPDPSSQQACTIGGNIACNSGGPHTLKVGVTSHHVLALELVTPDGARRWIGSRIPAHGGLDLAGLATGCEGTFGIVTRAWVRLVPSPPAARTLLAVFAQMDAACRAVSALITSGLVPAAVEIMDAPILAALHDAFGISFPEGAGAVVLVEVDGLEAGLDEEAAQAERRLWDAGASEVRRATGDAERARLWEARKRAFGALGRLARSYCTQDGVVPRTRLPEVLRRICAIGEKCDLRVANVFHAGDGNLHPILLYDERDAAQVERVLRASAEILEVCLDLGGSLTGEHGIGIEKVALMERAFSAGSLEAMRRVRAVFDPKGRCNPGKTLPAGGGCGDPVGSERRALGRVLASRRAAC